VINVKTAEALGISVPPVLLAPPMKSDGLRLQGTQLQEASRLFKLAAIALIAAVRTIQLVDARDGSPRPASDVAD